MAYRVWLLTVLVCVAGRVAADSGYVAARGRVAADRSAGMRIGKMPSERIDGDAERQRASTAQDDSDAGEDLVVRPGDTPAGGYTIELGDAFVTQVEWKSGADAECESGATVDR